MSNLSCDRVITGVAADGAAVVEFPGGTTSSGSEVAAGSGQVSDFTLFVKTPDGLQTQIFWLPDQIVGALGLPTSTGSTSAPVGGAVRRDRRSLRA